MSKNILISFIGKGKLDENGNVYLKTKYVFKDRDSYIEQSNICLAILKSKKVHFDKMILIGTKTSSWASLINNWVDDEKFGTEASELFFDILEKELGESKRKELEELLSRILNVSVEIRVDEYNPENLDLEDIVNSYTKIVSDIINAHEKFHISLDITHAFRPFPMLLYQIMQIYSNELENGSIDIFYGELGDKISYVRELNALWDISNLAREKHQFESRYNGIKLADRLYDYWRDGANWIKRFSNIIDSNLTMQIWPLYQHLEEIIIKYKKTEYSPDWVDEIHDFLVDINTELSSVSSQPFWLFYTFSKMLWTHQRYVQAIITLQCAIETAAVMVYTRGTKSIGNYEQIKEAMSNETFSGAATQDIRNVRKIGTMRNRVAHAGGEDWEKLPEFALLKNQDDFNYYLESAERILKYLEERL